MIQDCVPYEWLLDLIEDRLQAERLVIVEQHLANCGECLSLIERLMSRYPCEYRSTATRGAASGNAELTVEWLQGLKRRLRDELGESVVSPPRLPGLEILRELGSGGVGRVYLARQIGLDRLVAVKLLPRAERIGDAEWSRRRSRGLRGAQALARLDHPHIVRILQIGEQEGWSFGVLEYLDGGTLLDRMESPWSPREVIALGIALSSALETIHSEGWIHRDLKPSNILFTAAGSPKVADFGLAVVAGELADADEAREGTPAYMAPEQHQGRWREIGPATDQYALGLILDELLTGRRRSMPADSEAHPPGHALPRAALSGQDQQDSTLPRLEDLLARCLKPDPSARHPSMKVFNECLQFL